MPEHGQSPHPVTSDDFAVLGEARRPWLNPDALKARFLALSAETHPDRMHAAGEAVRAAAADRFATLNAAYARLREPKDRVLHLLRLECSAPPPDVQRIPPGTIELYNDIGAACRAVDALRVERDQESSPMRRLELFERGLDWTDRLEALRQAVQSRQQALLDELRVMNPVWEAAPAEEGPARRAALPLRRLGEIGQLLGYLARWTAQLEERRTRLAL